MSYFYFLCLVLILFSPLILISILWFIRGNNKNPFLGKMLLLHCFVLDILDIIIRAVIVLSSYALLPSWKCAKG